VISRPTGPFLKALQIVIELQMALEAVALYVSLKAQQLLAVEFLPCTSWIVW
jgi:hypothetical protein